LRRRTALIFPGDLGTLTGGYVYDRRAFAALQDRCWRVNRLSLSGSFPFPDDHALAAADAALGSLPDGLTAVVDGLALGAMPEAAARHGGRLALVGLVHHPLCLETGLEFCAAERLRASERAALAWCQRVIVTSPLTARTVVAEFGVPAERVTVALPGADPAPVASGSATRRPHLLCVGTLTPRKGHLLLLEALADLLDLDWTLACVGSGERDPATAAQVRETIAVLGLSDRVSLTGELSEEALSVAYARADVLVSASLYEGYGMVLAEGLARGLPIVAAAAGAVADTVPRAAGLLVPPLDREALTVALRQVLGEPDIRRRLREGALVAREGLPRWADTATAIEQALLACEVS
jgi:glycosyltransferase involved in cell wall biosynthesis